MCRLEYQNPFLVTKTKTIIYIQLHRNNNSIMRKESLSLSSQFIGIKLPVLSQFQAINNNLSQLHRNHKKQNYNDCHILKNSTSKLSINFSFLAQNINNTRDITQDCTFRNNFPKISWNQATKITTFQNYITQCNMNSQISHLHFHSQNYLHTHSYKSHLETKIHRIMWKL